MNRLLLKKLSLLILIMTSVLTIQAQIVNTNPDPNGEPWCAGGLPEITPPVIRELEIDVSLNNWGSNFNHAQHLASNVTVDYTYLPLWNLGDCSNESFDNASMMLASADSLVSTGEYVEAKDMYMQVVEDYPTTTSAATALKTLLSLEYNAGNDYEELQQYYLENDVIVNDTVLSSLASSLANKCNEELGNYTDAIAWYEEVITNPESSFNDSIFATIDLGNLYLNMADDRAKGIQGKLSQFVPESRKEYQEQTDYALSLLPKDKHTQNKSNIPNIVKDGAEYTTFIYYYYWDHIEPIKTLTAKFEGYTIIGEYEYMNVFQKDSSQSPEFQHIGYMREDDTGKVYFLQDGTEYWLYDFGMEVGDSIMNEWSNSYIRLDSITENEIGGTLRKCYHTSIYDDEMDYWFPSSVWVEGIGSLNGLLNVPEPPAPGGWISTLLCYKEYGEVIYMDEDFNDCEYTSTEENDITGNTLRVFPNPGEDILNIYTSLQNASIEVYDILGKVVYKQDITENITSIPTERWNSGMYLWKVYSEGNVVESGKWIKQ